MCCDWWLLQPGVADVLAAVSCTLQLTHTFNWGAKPVQAHAEFRRVMREKGVRVLTVRLHSFDSPAFAAGNVWWMLKPTPCKLQSVQSIKLALLSAAADCKLVLFAVSPPGARDPGLWHGRPCGGARGA